MPYRLTNMTHLGFYEVEVTLEQVPGIISWIFGGKTQVFKFRGSGTVWRHFPTGGRADLTMECIITDLVARHKMEEAARQKMRALPF
jgi:hypothetical protein